MKILMLTPYLPYPPASGGQIRTYNLLKYLSKHHNITLISLYKNEKEKEFASYLKSYCHQIYLCKRAENPWQLRNIFKSLFSFLPFLIVRNFSEEAKTTIEKLLKNERFDVIHAETFYIMPHIPKTNIPVLLVEQTIEFKVYQHFILSLPVLIKPFFYLDILKLKYWEIFYWKKATMVSSVSEYDRNIIRELTPSLNPVIIPNGAGDEMFTESLKPKKTDNQVLLFMGNFYWLQNVEAANYLIDTLFPRLQKSLPEARLIIAGQNAYRKLKSNGNPDIKIVDIAYDDSNTVKELYNQATLFIAPIFGPGGTRLKILAAMASGLPVVATKIGVEGLSTTHGVHVLLANTTNEFITQIQYALENNKMYELLRNNAHQLVKEKFSWKAIAQHLEIVYKSITSKHENRN